MTRAEDALSEAAVKRTSPPSAPEEEAPRPEVGGSFHEDDVAFTSDTTNSSSVVAVETLRSEACRVAVTLEAASYRAGDAVSGTVTLECAEPVIGKVRGMALASDPKNTLGEPHDATSLFSPHRMQQPHVGAPRSRAVLREDGTTLDRSRVDRRRHPRRRRLASVSSRAPLPRPPPPRPLSCARRAARGGDGAGQRARHAAADADHPAG